MKRRPGIRRLFRIAGRTRVENVVDEELAHHLQECADLLIGRGYDRAEAYREARRRFGDVGNYRSACVAIDRRRQRRTRIVEFTQSIIQDIRFAARGMRRYPSFTASIVLTLALGIGANAAIYTIIDASLLRPPPYPNAPSLATVAAEMAQGFQVGSFSITTARALQRSADIEIVVHTPRTGARTDLANPEELSLLVVDPGIFDLLGIVPSLGRPFTESDAGPQAEPVAILSHGYWLNRFGADPVVVGEVIRIDDVPFRIVGVLPSGFKFPRYSSADAWLVMDEDGIVPGTTNQEARVSLVADTGGETVDVAESRVSSAFAGMLERGEVSSVVRARLRSVSEQRINSDARTALWVLAGACGIMWLIAVVNGTNLFLVRNTARVRELKVRISLGAGRGRIARQIMTEALVLALVSGAISAMVTYATMSAILSILPREIASFSPNFISVSGRVLWFVFAVASLTGLLFGFVPTVAALRATRSGMPVTVVRAGVSRGATLVRHGFVVLQVMMAVVLLVGATLLMRSFSRLVNVDPGFDADGVLAMLITLPESRYGEGEARATFREEVLDRLRGLSGVSAVTEGTGLPSHTAFSFGGDSIGTDDGAWRVMSELTWISLANVDQHFFGMLRIPIVAGRDFTAADHGRDDVVIIDEDFARLLFGSPSSAVGRQVRRGGVERPWRTVVGVAGPSLLLSPVGSPQALGIDEEQTTYQYYQPTSASPDTYMVFAVRTADRTQRIAAAMREAVSATDPLQPVSRINWIADEYAETIAKPRFNSFLMTILATVATVLTLVGVYGVLSFTVSSRARDLGIRMALGAPSIRVQRLVLGSGLRLMIVGLVIGVAAALPLAKLLRTLLFQTSPSDMASFGFVGGLIAVAGAMASYLPARRATRVDPVTVLRSE